MSADRYRSLLDPLSASLKAVNAAARGRTNQLGAAEEFVYFKLHATLHLGDQIRQLLQSAKPSIIPLGDEEVIETRLDRAQSFALYVLVDSFLLESASIRDAVLQLVNVAFNLEIADDDRRFVGKVRTHLSVTSTSNTGLEEWIEQSRCPSWLSWLFELRNITAHRHPLRLPERYQWGPDGRVDPSWLGRIGIVCADGSYEPLETLIGRVEEELARLLQASLKRLISLLAE